MGLSAVGSSTNFLHGVLTNQIVCGDITDVTANGGHYVADSQCSMPCSGDPTHLCGAGNLLTTHYLNTPMNVWHTPSNTGYYGASTTSSFSAAALTRSLVDSS